MGVLSDAPFVAVCALALAAAAALAVAERLPRLGRRRAGLYPQFVIAGSLACLAFVAVSVLTNAPRTATVAALAALVFATAAARRHARAMSRLPRHGPTRPKRMPPT